MDWRLNGKNAEQNYKIIMDKGAVRMGVGEREDSIPPLLTQAPLRHRHSRPPPQKSSECKGVCYVCDPLAHGSGPAMPMCRTDVRSKAW